MKMLLSKPCYLIRLLYLDEHLENAEVEESVLNRWLYCVQPLIPQVFQHVYHRHFVALINLLNCVVDTWKKTIAAYVAQDEGGSETALSAPLSTQLAKVLVSISEEYEDISESNPMIEVGLNSDKVSMWM